MIWKKDSYPPDRSLAMPSRCLLLMLTTLAALTSGAGPLAAQPLPGTRALEMQGALASQMVDGIDKFLLREIERSVERRAALWKRDTSSASRYEASIAPNQERLRTYIGVVDRRV